MPTRITDEMLGAVATSYTADTVRRVRSVLAAAGVTGDVELHPLEVQQYVELRERERAARAGAERLLALGPLPPHACLVAPETQLVQHPSRCPYGCVRDQARREVP